MISGPEWAAIPALSRLLAEGGVDADLLTAFHRHLTGAAELSARDMRARLRQARKVSRNVGGQPEPAHKNLPELGQRYRQARYKYRRGAYEAQMLNEMRKKEGLPPIPRLG